MGSSDSKKLIQQEFQIVKIQPTGNTLLKSKIDQKQFLMRIISSSNKTDIGRIKSLLQCRAMLKNHHLLSLVEIKEKQRQNMCSRHYNLFVVLEYSFKSIGQEMIQRSLKVQKTYFNESQLWSIIYSCYTALNALYTNGATHQSISYNNIYINNDGYIKMADPLLFGLEKNYIQILDNKQKLNDNKQNDIIDVHLSPQIVGCLDQQNFQYYDREKSDIFILGMVMVDLALLKYNHLFYTKQQLKNLGVISGLMKELNQRYSSKFTNLLQKMLRIEPNQRLNIAQVIQIIQKTNNTSNVDQSILTQTLKQTSPDKSIMQNPILETAQKSRPIIIRQSIKPEPAIRQQNSFNSFNQHQQKTKTQPLAPIYSQVHHISGHYQNSLSIKEGHSMLNNQNFDGRVFISTNQTHQSNLYSHQGLFSTVKNIEPHYNQKSYFNDIKMLKNNPNNPSILYDNSKSIQSLKSCEHNDSEEDIQNHQQITENKFLKQNPRQQIVNNQPPQVRAIDNQKKNTVYNQSMPQKNVLIQQIKSVNNQIHRTTANTVVKNQFSPQNNNQKYVQSRQLNSSYQKQFSSPNKPTIIMKFINNDSPSNKPVNPSINSQKLTLNNTGYTPNQNRRVQYNPSGFNISTNTKVNIPSHNVQNSVNSSRQNTPCFQMTPKSDIKSIKNNFISQIHSNTGKGHITFVNNTINTPRNDINPHQIVNNFNQIYINSDSFKKQHAQTQKVVKQDVKNASNNKNKTFSPFKKPQQPIQQPILSSITTKISNKPVIFTHQIPQIYNLLKNNSNTPVNRQIFTKQEKKVVLDNHHVSTPQSMQTPTQVNRFVNFSNYPIQTISQFAQSRTSLYSPSYKQINQNGTIKRQGQKPLPKKQIFSHQLKDKSKMPIKLQEKKRSLDVQRIYNSPNQKNMITFNQLSDNFTPTDRITIKTQTYIMHQPMDINNPRLQIPVSKPVNKDLEYVVQQIPEKGRYQGYIFQKKKNGQGILYFKDGGHYNGQWKDDRMEGYGKLYYENGSIAYEGYWKSDEFCGKGRVYNSEPTSFHGEFDYHDFSELENKWIYYDGQFKNDEKNGKGYIKLANGQMFEGLFDHDMIEGNGIFYKSSGQIVVGYWINNHLFLNQSFGSQSKKSI